MATSPQPSPQTSATETATLGGGCFWCLEAVYDDLRGVKSIESGYMGGHTRQPSYEDVCSGETGHAEVVRVTFDPEQVSFRELLEVFFAIHDPTTRDRQGADVGTQYRSVIFYHSAEQKATAQSLIEELTRDRVFSDPIVTEVAPAADFYMAEPYHQEYFSRNPRQGYCTFVVAPKLAKFRAKFAERSKSKAS